MRNYLVIGTDIFKNGFSHVRDNIKNLIAKCFFHFTIFAQKPDMVEEAVRFGTRVNGDSDFRVPLVRRFGGRPRNFGGQHGMQQYVKDR